MSSVGAGWREGAAVETAEAVVAAAEAVVEAAVVVIAVVVAAAAVVIAALVAEAELRAVLTPYEGSGRRYSFHQRRNGE